MVRIKAIKAKIIPYKNIRGKSFLKNIPASSLLRDLNTTGDTTPIKKSINPTMSECKNIANSIIF